MTYEHTPNQQPVPEISILESIGKVEQLLAWSGIGQTISRQMGISPGENFPVQYDVVSGVIVVDELDANAVPTGAKAAFEALVYSDDYAAVSEGLKAFFSECNLDGSRNDNSIIYQVNIDGIASSGVINAVGLNNARLALFPEMNDTEVARFAQKLSTAQPLIEE